jgi:hypothetical protein
MKFYKHLTFSFLSIFIFPFAVAFPATLEIFSGDSFESAVENLQPGDILTVHGGTYSSAGRISITVVGTGSVPVLIQAATGETPLITRPDANQNVINIEGSAAYLTIRGLEIVGGADGINLSGQNHHVTIEDNHIHDVGEVGLNFRNNAHHLLIRRNHIHHTHDTAEGMYIGCNNSTCVVRDSVFENNWVHDTGMGPGDTQGDGIELKQGSYNNIIRDNVIYNTHWPCILVYGTDGNSQNIVEGNAMWDCGDAGIQVQGEAIVRNNIILNTTPGIGDGLISQNHQSSVTNLQIIHNTIIGNASDGCLVLRNWSGQANMVLANNASYCQGGQAINFVGGSSGVNVSANVVVGGVSGVSNGTLNGQSLSQDFIDAPGRNLWPTAVSSMASVADTLFSTTHDFNGTLRSSPLDVGAYEVESFTGNPGWLIQPGFKPPPPSVVIDTTPPAPPTGLQVQGL